MRVLVVDDERLFAAALKEALTLASMAVDVAHDGGAALEAVAVNSYDVVVLDRDLPVVHGDDVAREIAELPESPRILMLTASGLARQKVEGFRLGADDYLAKPFSLEELKSRIWALGRRPAEARPPVLRIGSVGLDPFKHEVARDGQLISLSRKEFAVLHLLMLAVGGPVSAETLLEKAWDENANPFTNSIRMTVSSLRKKLGRPFIATVPGVGYRVDSDDGS